MASLIRDKSGVYFIVHAQGSKRIWKSLRTRSKREANAKFSAENVPIPKKAEAKLANAVEEYLSFVRSNYSPKTLQIYRFCLKRFEAFVGSAPLCAISPRDLEKFKSQRLQKVTPITVNQDMRGLRAFFGKLMLWGELDKSPCAGVKDIRIADQPKAFLSESDLRSLLEHSAGSLLHDVILLAVNTGLRRGELVNLRWEHVDFEKGTILVRSNGEFRTKSGRMRVIPMNSTVRGLLETMKDQSGYVFKGKRGGQVSGNWLRNRFKSAVRAIGLDSKLHFHSLRHTFASHLVQRGASLYHVQALLGHSSSRMTEGYAHLGGERLHRTVDLLSGEGMRN